jgi:hypothetical protein
VTGGKFLTNIENPIVSENVDLSEKERKVINTLRYIKYSEVKIVLQDGVIVRMDEIRKSIEI